MMLQFMRLIHQYLETKLEGAANEERVIVLAETAFNCLSTDYQNGDMSDSRFHSTVHSLMRQLFSSAQRVMVPFSLSDDDSRLLTSLNETLLQNEDLAVDFDHPLPVLLADVFESTVTIHEHSLRQALAHLLPNEDEVMEDEAQNESPDAKTLIAVAHFRHAAKILVRKLLEVM